MKIAAAYIRVSTDDQIEYSPESQRKAIYDYAKRNGYLVPEEYVFADEGISGRSTRRPAFQRMIGLAKQKPKPFDCILVWKFSRFARNREDSIVYKSMLRKQCGIDVVSISEQLGEDKTSILIEALLEAMDEYYSINLAEEVVRGMSEKARHGGIMGGLAYGYRSENGKIVPDPETAPIVQMIFREFIAGTPIRKIVNIINDMGILTRYGNKWDYRGVEYVIRNISYLGKTHWTPGGTNSTHADKIAENTIVSDVTHTPIIDEETFKLAQERVADLKRKHIYKAHPQHGTLFMLKGLVRCGSCGATLTRSNQSGLQCHQYSTGKCKTSHYIAFYKINQMVIDKLQSDFESGRFETMLQRGDDRKTETNALLQAELDRTRQKLQRAKEAYQAGIDSIEEYRENKIRLTEQIQRLTEQMQQQPDSVNHDEIIEKLKSSIKSGLEIIKSDAPEELKNEVLCAFIDHITFNRENCSVEVYYGI